MNCAHCGEAVSPSWKECPYCDKPLSQNKRRSKTILESFSSTTTAPEHSETPQPQHHSPPPQQPRFQKGPKLHNDGFSQFHTSYPQEEPKPAPTKQVQAHQIPIPNVSATPAPSVSRPKNVSLNAAVLDKLYGAVVVIHKSKVWSVPLLAHLTKIGRDPENDIVIDDTSVSSFHADILLKGATLYYDRSTNGSRVDGEIVSESMKTIQSGSQVEIGEHTLIIFLSEHKNG